MAATKSKTKSRGRSGSMAAVGRMVFLNLAEHYGAGMTFSELAKALGGQEHNPVLRAVVQVLRYQLGAARAHELAPTATHSERDYGAGAARVTEDSLNWLHLLAKHEKNSSQLAELRGAFPDPKLEE